VSRGFFDEDNKVTRRIPQNPAISSQSSGPASTLRGFEDQQLNARNSQMSQIELDQIMFAQMEKLSQARMHSLTQARVQSKLPNPYTSEAQGQNMGAMGSSRPSELGYAREHNRAHGMDAGVLCSTRLAGQSSLLKSMQEQQAMANLHQRDQWANGGVHSQMRGYSEDGLKQTLNSVQEMLRKREEFLKRSHF